MVKSAAGLVTAVVFMWASNPLTVPVTRSVCDLSRDYAAYRDKFVAVRGVYYDGLRQTCLQKCADGPWPSFLHLVGDSGDVWDAVEKAERTVELEAKKGNRLEVWVTAVGTLRTMVRRSRLGPCDKAGSRYYGYGHLGAFPAELQVKRFIDIEVKANPSSPYDYSNIYRGPV
jgi:hypothetical protein